MLCILLLELTHFLICFIYLLFFQAQSNTVSTLAMQRASNGKPITKIRYPGNIMDY